MLTSSNSNSPTSARGLPRGSIKSLLWKTVLAISLYLSFFLVLAANMRSISPGSADQKCQTDQRSPCSAKPTDLAFIIDRSGSMANRIDHPSPDTSSLGRGQTYNMQIEGVLRALGDPTVIPRDGSIAITVVTFGGGASVKVPRTEINRAENICAIQSIVEALKCGDPDSIQEPCPSGNTLFSEAIKVANDELKAGFGRGSRRLFLMSTDGESNDLQAAINTADKIEEETRLAGIASELDLILVGLTDINELIRNQSNADRIVFPKPADDLPGKTMIIPANACNSRGQLNFSECNIQADEFARLTRMALRSNISKLSLVVTTDADVAPNTPESPDGEMSLRQALEAANCRGGATTITFDNRLKGKIIRLRTPLPPLVAPDIVIDGCIGTDCAESMTIDGSQINSALPAEHSNGILIRSNRDVVRNLRITNFPRAGIAIEPVCASDAVGYNRIERNTLSGNKVAGILVLDPELTMPCSFLNGVASKTEVHNIGNIISKNTISDSGTLIDLGGDGPTPNDPDDGDVGPNTLLNFPNALDVTKQAQGVAITGQVKGPSRAGATVEIFAVTSSRIVSGKLVIDGVTYLATATTNNNGEFRIEGAPSSPTGIYTATVTDLQGNTSELMFVSGITGPAFPNISITEFIDFGELNLNTTSPARQVIITNTGKAPLIIKGCAIQKCDPADKDDAARFNNTDCPNESTLINPGSQVKMNVTFTPRECGLALACLFIASNAVNAEQIRSTLSGAGVSQAQTEVIIDDGGKSLEFGPVAAVGALGGVTIPTKCFGIRNTGCVPLNLTFKSIKRKVDDADGARISSTKEKVFFNLKAIVGGVSKDVPAGTAIPEAINPNDTMHFCVQFNPVAPAIAGQTCGAPSNRLSADQVLPDSFTSQLIFTKTGGKKFSVDIKSKVDRVVKLIHPCAPLLKDPLILFTKSGDILTVTFYVFDPGLDIDRVMYRFLDASDNEVALDKPITDLKSFKAQFVKGQTFGVIQDFSRAKKHPEVSTVEVTIFDSARNSDSWKSRPLGSASNITQSLQRTNIATLSLPALKLESARPGNRARARSTSQRKPH